MGRHTDAVCRLCRREGIKLYLKGARCDSPKCAIERRNGPPGMHTRRGKQSEYGVRLREKQKLKRFYGLFEKQFRRFFHIASQSTANTGEQLLSLMERRLDNVVHRLGFINNRAGARQFIAHGHILVNGRMVNIPSYILRPGDVITVKDAKRSRQLVALQLKDNNAPVPDYLERTSTEPPEGRVLRMPSRDDIDPRIKDINEQMIIEISTR
jgi:small subunit ribosomal protein S4